ncbi:MAG: biotin transporter BioY [Alphaproteobacteria bacterium]
MERNVAHIALFAALIVVLGLLPKFTLVSGVPITAQSLGVMLCGAVLGARRGALAVLLFLALIAIGLPFLAGGRGGLGVFASPTVGFLVGWPVAAYVTGLIMQRGRPAAVFWRTIVASVIGGIIVMYAFGIPGMAIVLEKDLVTAAGFALPFVPGDLVKAVVAGFVVQALNRLRPSLLASVRD